MDEAPVVVISCTCNEVFKYMLQCALLEVVTSNDIPAFRKRAQAIAQNSLPTAKWEVPTSKLTCAVLKES